MFNRLLRPLGRDLRASLDDDINESRLAPPSAAADPVRDADLADLPHAVQRYLHFMGVVGRPRDVSFRAHFRGRFRMRPGQHFMPCEVWQYDSVEIARLFHMRIDCAGFVPMVGRDSYVRGHGRMRGKLLGIVTVADGQGPKFDIGELSTYLNDAVLLAPSMLLTTGVTWAAVDNTSFDVSLTDAGRTATARVFLDERGAPRDFSTSDRFAALPGGLVRAEWTTPVSGWTTVDGRSMPTRGAAVWHLPEGEFTYAEFTFEPDSIEYNAVATRYQYSDASSRSGTPPAP